MGALEEDMDQMKNRLVMTVGGARSRRSQVGTQRAARTIVHSRVDGERSHGGHLADDTRGMPDRDKAKGNGSQDADGEQMELGETDGSGGQGGAAALWWSQGA